MGMRTSLNLCSELNDIRESVQKSKEKNIGRRFLDAERIVKDLGGVMSRINEANQLFIVSGSLDL
jgi:hypothetical protein